MKRTVRDIEEILKKAKSSLRKIYGKRLKGIILYGSYARGDADDGSDIDLIILLEDMKNACAEIDRCSEEIHHLDYIYDTLISIIPIDMKEYNTRLSPLILNAKREGIPV
ncbi:MAG: nucleotidyltransferase domain-containing protein [bacterium]